MPLFQRILVPVDGSATSLAALACAIDLAQRHDGQLRVLHVIDEVLFTTGFEYSGDLQGAVQANAEKVLESAMATAKSAGVACDASLLHLMGQRLGQRVADAAREWQADLIVVGTHGRHGVDRMLMGSGAEQIIRLASAPVLVIRGAEPT